MPIKSIELRALIIDFQIHSKTITLQFLVEWIILLFAFMKNYLIYQKNSRLISFGLNSQYLLFARFRFVIINRNKFVLTEMCHFGMPFVNFKRGPVFFLINLTRALLMIGKRFNCLWSLRIWSAVVWSFEFLSQLGGNFWI